MKKLYFIFLVLIGLFLVLPAEAQNFKAKQQAQERTIRVAYKRGKITEREYQKLLDEQTSIKIAIEKYEYDRVWTPHEKNVVHDKLVRAEKRLRRYRTNGEVY